LNPHIPLRSQPGVVHGSGQPAGRVGSKILDAYFSFIHNVRFAAVLVVRAEVLLEIFLRISGSVCSHFWVLHIEEGNYLPFHNVPNL